MSLKYGFSILVLLFLVALLGLKNYEVWNRPFEVAEQNSVVRKKGINPGAAEATKESKTNTRSNTPYVFIAQKNIFNPERKDFPVIPSGQNNATVRPQVILYGVAVADAYRAASISNPGRPLMKGEREIVSLRVGEKIGGYTLSKILPDRITLEGTNDSFDVLLYDPTKPKKRTLIQTENKPAASVTTPFPSPQGLTEGSQPVSPEEILQGTAQGKAAFPPASTTLGQGKGSSSSLPVPASSPLPPPTATPLPPPSVTPTASPPPTVTPLPPPPPPTILKMDPALQQKIPAQGPPGK